MWLWSCLPLCSTQVFWMTKRSNNTNELYLLISQPKEVTLQLMLSLRAVSFIGLILQGKKLLLSIITSLPIAFDFHVCLSSIYNFFNRSQFCKVHDLHVTNNYLGSVYYVIICIWIKSIYFIPLVSSVSHLYWGLPLAYQVPLVKIMLFHLILD